MATLADVRFIAERDIEDHLDNDSVIAWANAAQNEFMLRIFIPDSLTLPVNTTDLSYDLTVENIREFRRIRRQSDLDNGVNRPYYPVYTFYNGIFEVPVAFQTTDTLLIDFYRFMTYFTDIEDTIDLDERFLPLYTTYIKSQYYQLSSTAERIGVERASIKHQEALNAHNIAKKQVADYYIIATKPERVKESGWGIT